MKGEFTWADGDSTTKHVIEIPIYDDDEFEMTGAAADPLAVFLRVEAERAILTKRKEAFANAAALVQSRPTQHDKDTKVLPSLPSAKPGAHADSHAADPVQSKLDAAVQLPPLEDLADVSAVEARRRGAAERRPSIGTVCIAELTERLE